METQLDESQANNHEVPESDAESSGLSPHLEGRELWRSLEHLAQTDDFKAFADREFQEGAQLLEGDDRRQFIKVMGASFALAGLAGAACRRLPESKIAPYAHRPADRLPGMPVDYASNFELGGIATGVRVRSYDGRPINLEGNGLHPGSSHACGVMAQATVLSLYDPDRLRVLKRKGEPSDWAAFEKWMTERCSAHAGKGGGEGLAILSHATSGPSMDRMKARFKSTFPAATWTEWEAVNDDNAYLGSKAAFGDPHRSHPRLASAEVVVSLGADFLGADVNSMFNATNWSKRRHLEGQPSQASMSRVYQFESMLSVTGMAADERVSVRSSDMSDLAALLLARLAGGKIDASRFEKSLRDSNNRTFVDADGKEVSLNDLGVFEKAASDLDEHRGRCLVLAGDGQPPAVHAAAAHLNQVLGNVGKTITYTALEKRPTRVEALGSLVKALDAGSVKTLVMFEVDPAYDAPANFKFTDAMAKAEEVVYVGTHSNKTNASDACKWVVPGTHYLEAWGDARSYDGTIGIIQPLIYPLVDSSQGARSALELVALMTSAEKTDGLTFVRDTAAQRYGTSEFEFERRWRTVLASGFEAKTKTTAATPRPTTASAVLGAVRESINEMRAGGGTEDVELVLYHDAKVYDGRFGNVGWMQELPDPVTKLTWDNALIMGPVLAEAKGLKSGDMVEMQTPAGSMKAAVMLMPGVAANTCALSIGYGRGKSAGPIADGAGFDVYPLRKSNRMDLVQKVSFVSQGEVYPLAHTQDHGTAGSLINEVVQEGIQERLPSIVREGSLEMYRENPGFAHGLAHIAHRLSLWEETNLDGAKFRWAMSVDLSTCTGCSACVTACQAENNVAVVGKDQVLRGREMHWIRIDRYFKGGNVTRPEQVVTQPVTCQQCENAPCEQVCPVAATVHDKDGLNVMVYNRCIGTRYCSNNCPYKVRRFNFFDYNRREPVRSQDGIFAVKPSYYTSDGPPEWRRMQFNPDVTVRSRGVMEKCSFCVQRISAAKIKYKNAWVRSGGGANENARDWEIPDGAIVTACQHACPTNAIVFGNLNDPESRVSKLHANVRTYDLLGELNTKPRLKYMAKVSNPSAPRSVFASGDHGSHGGHGGHGGHDDDGDTGHDHDHDHDDDHDDQAGSGPVPNATEVRT